MEIGWNGMILGGLLICSTYLSNYKNATLTLKVHSLTRIKAHGLVARSNLLPENFNHPLMYIK